MTSSSISALPNCTYTLGNDLAFLAPTIQTEGSSCYRKQDTLTFETNQVTLQLTPFSNPVGGELEAPIKITLGGQILPHLIGNCQQGSWKTPAGSTGSPKKAVPDLWLQMGTEHCILIHRDRRRSWIKAEQTCLQYYGGHLLSLHNEVDEKLVQNLVFNRWESLYISWSKISS